MAKKENAAKGQGKKRGFGASVLWGLLGLLILVAGVGSALFYMNQDSMESIGQLSVIKKFIDKTASGDSGAPMDWLAKDDKGKGAPAAKPKKKGGLFSSMLGGSNSYLVERGDSMWSIATNSNLVESPFEWRTIMVQNRDKLEYAFISDESPEWQVILPAGVELQVDSSERTPPPPPENKRYAIQLAAMSENQLPRADKVVRRLITDGYFVYLYPFEDDRGLWYRIRTGFYNSPDVASAVAREIQERYAEQNYFPGELKPITVEPDEQMGDKLVMGVQRVAPWVVQLAGRGTHREALLDLRTTRMAGTFAYIHQRREPGADQYTYSIRIGYYTTRKEAEALIAGNNGAEWQGARPVQVWNFEEALPGQTLKIPAVSSL